MDSTLLNLILEENKFHAALVRAALEIFEADDIDAETMFDRIHDWRKARAAACDAAMEQVYDQLFVMIADESEHQLNRSTFLKHQAARRRRQSKAA